MMLQTVIAMAAAGAEGFAASPFVSLAYLIAGVLFILALRGLSSPASSRRGNRMGMAGMAIAVATTLYTHDVISLPEIVGAIAIGGAIGTGLFLGVAETVKMAGPSILLGYAVVTARRAWRPAPPG